MGEPDFSFLLLQLPPLFAFDPKLLLIRKVGLISPHGVLVPFAAQAFIAPAFFNPVGVVFGPHGDLPKAYADVNFSPY
jgi:hypothetical protein